MTAAGQKAIRDFWSERTRSVLVIVAIALGIAGFQTVMSSYAILTRELDRGYLATNPASATLRTDRIDDQLLAEITANPEISDAEPRRIVTGRIKTGPIEWRNLTLFVVEDYGNIRVSKLEPQAGAWPPSTGEILIERDAFQVAHAKIGDTVRLKTANGHEQTLRIAGSVHDVGQAQARMEQVVYGYINLDTLRLLGEEAYLDQVNLLVAKDRFNEEHIRAVTSDVKSLIESRGHPVRRVDIPRPGKHPHSDLMGTLLLAMSTFGLFVLVLSGILVFNLLTALMASQVRQIGVMKAIGGTRHQIALIYFAQAALLGVAAIAVALPMGILGSRALCRYMAIFLNFDINSFATPTWVYLLSACVGLLVPLVAAAYPVWKGTVVTVHEALADFGVTAASFGNGRFDRAVAHIGGVFRPLLLSVRNSFRRRARLALTLVTLTAGGLFFMSALNVRASLINTLDQMFGARRFDLTLSLGSMYPYDKVERAIRNTSGILRSEGWFATEGVLPEKGSTPFAAGAPEPGKHVIRAGPHSGGSSPGSNRFTVIALPAETGMLKMQIVEGRGLLADDTDAIILNTALADRTHVKPGDTMAFQMGPVETSWKVVGIAREAFSPPVAYIPKSFIEARHPGITNTVRLVLERPDRDFINQVKQDLESKLEQEDIHALSTTSKADSRRGFDEHMVMIYIFLVVMSCIIGGVGCLGLATTMNINILERRREMGILRTIGATPRVVSLIIVAEALAIGIMSWLLSSFIAWPFSKVLANTISRAMFKSGLDFYFDQRGVWIWLAASVMCALIASFLAAWHASRSTIREAIGYE